MALRHPHTQHDASDQPCHACEHSPIKKGGEKREWAFTLREGWTSEPTRAETEFREEKLKMVFTAFDLDGDGAIEPEELFELATARRKAGQVGDGNGNAKEWTREDNIHLINKIEKRSKPERQDSLITEDEFIKYFNLHLPRDNHQFGRVIGEFLQAGKIALRARSMGLRLEEMAKLEDVPKPLLADPIPRWEKRNMHVPDVLKQTMFDMRSITARINEPPEGHKEFGLKDKTQEEFEKAHEDHLSLRAMLERFKEPEKCETPAFMHLMSASKYDSDTLHSDLIAKGHASVVFGGKPFPPVEEEGEESPVPPPLPLAPSHKELLYQGKKSAQILAALGLDIPPPDQSKLQPGPAPEFAGTMVVPPPTNAEDPRIHVHMVTGEGSPSKNDGQGKPEFEASVKFGQSPFEIFGNEHTDKMKVYVVDSGHHTSLSLHPKSQWGLTAACLTESGSLSGLSDEGEVTLARSEECPFGVLRARSQLSALLQKPPHPFVQAAVVTIAQDRSKRICITRRARTEKYFPGAWVMPGTIVQPGQSLRQAAAESLMRETKLEVVTEGFGSMKLCGIYESVFPSSVDQGNPQGHFLVFFYLGHVKDPLALDISSGDNLDACAWVDREEVDYLTQTKQLKPKGLPRRVYGWETTTGNLAATAFPFDTMAGTYPNKFGQGLVPGHLWMLEEWASKAWYQHTYTFQ